MSDEVKTPEQEAEKQLNKQFGKAIAKRMLEIKQHEAKIKKLNKEIEKIKKGELVPGDEDDSSSHSTLINFILDETGSMHERKETTINSFNEYIQTMRKEKGSVKLTLTTFNSSKINIVYKNKDIKDVPLLNKDNYQPNDMTPLYDAVGKTINSINKEINKNTAVLFVILTDGEENSSREFTKDGITKLIKEKEAKGWKFVYMGVGQDAWDGGYGMGIKAGNVVSLGGGNVRGGVQLMASYSSAFTRSGGKASMSQFKIKNKQRLGRLKR